MRRNAILLTCYSFVISDGDINLFNSQLWYRQNITLVIVPWEKERGKKRDRKLKDLLVWMCILRYSASDCAHRHDNVGRQIVTLRAENYYVAANNYSGRRSRRKVQSVIRSLPRNTAMWFQHCSGPKAVICDCDYGRSCQECLRHEIVKFFSSRAHRTEGHFFRERTDRVRPPAFSRNCSLVFFFRIELKKEKGKILRGQIIIHYTLALR